MSGPGLDQLGTRMKKNKKQLPTQTEKFVFFFSLSDPKTKSSKRKENQQTIELKSREPRCNVCSLNGK